MIEDLIQRYKIRLTQVYKSPNFYYGKPLYEITEIKQWIKKLEKINAIHRP